MKQKQSKQKWNLCFAFDLSLCLHINTHLSLLALSLSPSPSPLSLSMTLYHFFLYFSVRIRVHIFHGSCSTTGWFVNAHCNLFHKYQNGIFTLCNRRSGGTFCMRNHVFETQSFVRMSQFHRRLHVSFFSKVAKSVSMVFDCHLPFFRYFLLQAGLEAAKEKNLIFFCNQQRN